MRQFVLIITVLVLVLVVWSQFDTTVLERSEARIISVEGNGEIEVTPDLIRLNYNLSQLHDSDVSVAKTDVDQRASASVRALLKLGIKEDDITSSALNVSTIEDYNNRDGTRTRRHRVQRDVEIVIRDVSLYNKVTDALVANKVSAITRIQPDVSNYDALKQQALASAAQNAHEQAEFLADQFDANLDGVHQIGRQNIQRHFGMQEALMSAAKSDSAQPKEIPYDFKPGKVKVTSNVYVEFELD